MSMPRPSVRAVLAVTSNTAFLDLHGMPNLIRAYGALYTVLPSNAVIVASSPEDAPQVRELLAHTAAKYELITCQPREPISLMRALHPYVKNSESILIHDASHPLTSQQQFEDVLAAFDDQIDAVRPSMPFTETLKVLGAHSIIKKTLDRTTVLRISSPELIRVSAVDIEGEDCGWSLPLRKDAKTTHTAGTPEGLRINSLADRDLMELYQD